MPATLQGRTRFGNLLLLTAEMRACSRSTQLPFSESPQPCCWCGLVVPADQDGSSAGRHALHATSILTQCKQCMHTNRLLQDDSFSECCIYCLQKASAHNEQAHVASDKCS